MPSDVLTNRHMAKLGMAPQPVSWSDGPLTIQDVSKFFSVPIAEAAQKLSVCGSVLQRICKENGIARWPYRKVTSGKSAEEIIEEGIKELASNPSAYKVAEKQPPTTPENTSNISGTPVASIPISSPPTEPDSVMNVGQPDPKRPARQQEVALVQPSPSQKSTQRNASGAQAKTLAQGSTPPQRVNQQGTPSHLNSPASSHVRSTAALHPLTPQKQKPASILDDFKIGFPTKGLRRASTRWWGSLEKESAILPEPAGDRDAELMCPESTVKGLESVSEVSPPTASSLLVRTRRKASLRGRSAVAHAVTRGYGLHQLGAKDAATLKFVFGDYLPKHWTSSFPPMP
ncbi:hypothetical protein M758_2G147800 [Ceratodon purpureus]|nr:hypothetical protein M758_2G147800 [Ceratodon purpureus]